MAGNYAQLLDIINNPTQHGLPAWDNNAKQIEGETVQQYLLTIINSLTVGYQFMGVASTNTSGGTPDQNVCYIAGVGEYTGFGSNTITIDAGYLGVIMWNGAWSANLIKIADAVSVSQNRLSIGNTEVLTMPDAFFGYLDLNREPGAVSAADGSITVVVNNFYIKVPVKGAAKISVQMFRTGGGYGLAFFDSDDNYISGQYNDTEPGGTRFEYDVPERAEYMLYSYLNDDVADSLEVPRFNGIGLVPIDTNSIYENIQGIDTIKRDSIYLGNLGAVNATNGTLIYGPNNFYIKVDIQDAWKLNLQVFRTADVYGLAFLDSSDNYISGYYTQTLPSGTRIDLSVPNNAKYLLYSYYTDAVAESLGSPVFDYIKVYKRKADTISEIEYVLENTILPSKRPRTATGVESFTVSVNVNRALLDTDDQIGDVANMMTDYGIVQLPVNYSQNGEPVPLAVVCHGAGASLSQYQNPQVVDGKAMGDPSKYLVQKGYAVFDMFAAPVGLLGGSELHIGNPTVLLCYKAGYDYVVKNYNVKSDALFVSGSSMGGLSSFQIVQSGIFPVKAQAGFAPCTDLFKQAYCDPWADSLRQKISTLFAFEGTPPTFGGTNYPTQAEITYFQTNLDKIIGYNPISRMLVNGNYADTFNVIPADFNVESVPEEAAIYANFRAIHPVPLKIWHCKNDFVVAFRYSQYLVDMLRRAGQLAFLRPFETGGHNAWNQGDTVNDVDIEGNAITTHVAERECYLWFERFK